MKPNTVLFAYMASVSLAGPFVMPPADTTAVPEVSSASAAADCKQCDEFFGKCRSSVWCFYNPWGCYATCNTDTCRNFNQVCTPCGYTGKC